jgi:hypothetical protein
VLRFYSLKTIAATNRAFIVPHEHGLALAYQPLVNADSYLPWRTKCPVRALAGEVDLYMGILNLPSKEPAKAEAEQDIDQAGQVSAGMQNLGLSYVGSSRPCLPHISS